MNDLVIRTLKSLKKRGMKSWLASDVEEARETMLGMVSPDATVGVGDSSTVRQIGIIEALKARGVRVINPFDPNKENKTLELNFTDTFWPMLEATVCDVFLTGANGLTEDGKIVNIDGVGNRVAGTVWGHPVSIIAVGRNKIVKDINAALDRIKNVIAPEHISRKEDSGKGPPCTVSKECHDCSGGKESLCGYNNH